MYRWLRIWETKSKGITLIELLVAITIFSVVGVAVGSIFASGIKVWRRAEGLNIRQRKALLGLEKVAQELRSSLDFPDIGFSGEKDWLSFPLLVDQDIAKVTYVFDSQQGVIFREENAFRDILDEKEGERKGFLPSVSGLSLSYWFFDGDEEEYRWRDSWSEEEGIPLAIKIELMHGDETFTETVSIPIL